MFAAASNELPASMHPSGPLLPHDVISVLTSSGTEARRYGPANVLLVSSDRRDHGRIGGPLFDAGCRVESAHTAEQAKAFVQSGDVDVVVTAEQLSDGDWQELRVHCEKYSECAKSVAFVVVLGHADAGRMAALLQLGASDTIAHPIDHAKLLRAVAVAHARVMRSREIRRARMSNPSGRSTVAGADSKETL